jgi:hypothetical protein
VVRDIVRLKPSVISADPWFTWTNGYQLPEWLFVNGLCTQNDLASFRQLIANAYVEVQFNGLRGMPFGRIFWVRQDRLSAVSLPPTAEISKNKSN